MRYCIAHIAHATECDPPNHNNALKVTYLADVVDDVVVDLDIGPEAESAYLSVAGDLSSQSELQL